jgi:hypothetical protein
MTIAGKVRDGKAAVKFSDLNISFIEIKDNTIWLQVTGNAAPSGLKGVLLKSGGFKYKIMLIRENTDWKIADMTE